jgi:hypothetical protein
VWLLAGHCKRLAPAWGELATAFKGHENIRIAHVDCTTDRDVCTTADVSCRMDKQLRRSLAMTHTHACSYAARTPLSLGLCVLMVRALERLIEHIHQAAV